MSFCGQYIQPELDTPFVRSHQKLLVCHAEAIILTELCVNSIKSSSMRHTCTYYLMLSSQSRCNCNCIRPTQRSLSRPCCGRQSADCYRCCTIRGILQPVDLNRYGHSPTSIIVKMRLNNKDGDIVRCTM
jgi:hypothetical protein